MGKIKHIYFFELAGGSEFTGHYVDRQINKIDNTRISLSDTGCFGNHQVKSRGFGHINDFGKGMGNFRS